MKTKIVSRKARMMVSGLMLVPEASIRVDLGRVPHDFVAQLARYQSRGDLWVEVSRLKPLPTTGVRE